jgi:hypothetical protein
MVKIIFLFFLLYTPTSFAKEKEKHYQEIFCNNLNGKIEYKLSDSTRIDCLTNKFAIEIDFQKKVYECYAQAIYYSEKIAQDEGITAKPACALIVGGNKSRYIERFEVINYDNRVELMLIDE